VSLSNGDYDQIPLPDNFFPEGITVTPGGHRVTSQSKRPLRSTKPWRFAPMTAGVTSRGSTRIAIP